MKGNYDDIVQQAMDKDSGGSQPDPQALAQQVAQLIQSGMNPQQFMQMVQQAMQGSGSQDDSQDDDQGDDDNG